MCNLPYIPFNIADFLADDKVALMTTEEVGAYILLLCRAWQQDPPGSLPDNDEFLASWTRLPELRWSQIKGRVLMPFVHNPSCVGGRWEQRRMMDDHERITKSIQEKSDNGKRAAEARWKKDSMQTQCGGNAIKKVKGKKETTTREKLTWTEEDGWGGIVDDKIAGWAEAYPRVDVQSELNKMHQWLLANPGKRKTQRGLPRFINSWLSRANEKGADDGNKRATEHAETGLGNVLDIRGG